MEGPCWDMAMKIYCNFQGKAAVLGNSHTQQQQQQQVWLGASDRLRPLSARHFFSRRTKKPLDVKKSNNIGKILIKNDYGVK